MFGILKRLIVVLALGLCLSAAAVPAHADWRDDCPRLIRQAEYRYRRAVRIHGPGSPQAERRRIQLRRIREQCRVYYRHRRHHHRYYRDY